MTSTPGTTQCNLSFVVAFLEVYSFSELHMVQVVDYLVRFESEVAGTAIDSRGENEALEKYRAPQDIEHSFKANWIYELPFGRGKWFWRAPTDF